MRGKELAAQVELVRSMLYEVAKQAEVPYQKAEILTYVGQIENDMVALADWLSEQGEG